MRVFISSTCFDLIDVRAELAEQFRTLGITPVLSDDKLSDFRVQHDVNSIETCLINVDSCDEFVLILDKRYGPTLEKFDYGEFSATHLEYNRAVEKKIPVRVYVRDRLEADFAIWKRNRRSDEVTFAWIDKKDIGLFTLLDGHAPLEANATTSNWYSTFTNSIDLKAAITKRFEKRILPERLVQAIQNNNFPIIDVKFVNGPNSTTSNGRTTASFKVIITNISSVPAFNLNACWYDDKKSEKIFPATHAISMQFTAQFNNYCNENNVWKYFIVEYESSIGISVHEQFCTKSNATIQGGKLIDRKYYRSSNISIEIEDDL